MAEKPKNNTLLFALIGAFALLLALLGALLIFGGFGEPELEPSAAEIADESLTDEIASSVAQSDVQATLPPPPRPTDIPVSTPTSTPLATPTAESTATPIPENTPTPAPVDSAPVAVAQPTATAIPPTPTEAGSCYLSEQGGMLLIDIETAPAINGWVFEASAPGYIGAGYYTYRGADSKQGPGSATLSYPIYINNPGEYLVRIHNYHDDGNSTEGNDAWLQISGVQPWIKTWSGDRSLWNWGNNFETSHNNHTGPEVTFPAAGPYTLQISGRSPGFSIDRIIIVTPDQFIPGTNQALPQSGCQPG
jgi:hypothetical protein